ncbi:MAG: hypothetical protein AAF702_20125 [Chloroflexota bacterium]
MQLLFRVVHGKVGRALSTFLISLFLFLTLLFSSNMSNNRIAYAGGELFCFDAGVFDHVNQPLGAGWEIIAISQNGSHDNINGLTNRSGLARFNLPVGEWTLRLVIPDSYIRITSPELSITVTSTQQSRGCTNVLFKVQRVVSVTIIKLNQEQRPLPGWTIKVNPAPGYELGKSDPVTATTSITGVAHFNLTEGVWIFSEMEPEGVDFAVVAPIGGSIGVTITAPGPHTIYFDNRIRPKGCIDVQMMAKAVPGSNGIDFPLAQWGASVLKSDGTPHVQGITDINGFVRFSDLPFGPYQVETENRIGWRPLGPSVVDVSIERDDACVQVTFQYRQDHAHCIQGRMIERIKLGDDQEFEVGVADWPIIAAIVDDSGFPLQETRTDWEGRYEFRLPENDYRITNNVQFEVCAIAQPSWSILGEQCQVVEIGPAGQCAPVKGFEIQPAPIITATPIPEGGVVPSQSPQLDLSVTSGKVTSGTLESTTEITGDLIAEDETEGGASAVQSSISKAASSGEHPTSDAVVSADVITSSREVASDNNTTGSEVSSGVDTTSSTEGIPQVKAVSSNGVPFSQEGSSYAEPISGTLPALVQVTPQVVIISSVVVTSSDETAVPTSLPTFTVAPTSTSAATQPVTPMPTQTPKPTQTLLPTLTSIPTATATPVPTTTQPTTSQCKQHHVAKRGEGLFVIAVRYNRSLSDMLLANPEIQKHPQLQISMGQLICVP